MENYIKINDETYISEKQHKAEIEEFEYKATEDLRKELEEVKANPDRKKIKSIRFGEKEHLKLIKLMSSLFQIENESVNEEWAVNNEFGVIDPANVCLVIGKTEEAKRFLSIFKAFESEVKVPNMDWTPDYEFFPEKETKDQVNVNPQKVKLSQEYMRKIIEILNATEDSINITVKYDYPALIENKHFKFILAPRIMGEE